MDMMNSETVCGTLDCILMFDDLKRLTKCVQCNSRLIRNTDSECLAVHSLLFHLVIKTSAFVHKKQN